MAGELDAFINEIKSDLRDAVGLAMEEAKYSSEKKGIREFGSFYSKGKPKIYERTEQLKRSFKTYPESGDGIMMSGDTFSYSLYVKEPHYGMNENRQRFIEAGYGSSLGFDGYRVVNAANAGTHFIKGKPGFWDRTLIAAEKYLDKYMKRELKKFG